MCGLRVDSTASELVYRHLLNAQRPVVSNILSVLPIPTDTAADKQDQAHKTSLVE